MNLLKESNSKSYENFVHERKTNKNSLSEVKLISQCVNYIKAKILIV